MRKEEEIKPKVREESSMEKEKTIQRKNHQKVQLSLKLSLKQDKLNQKEIFTKLLQIKKERS